MTLLIKHRNCSVCSVITSLISWTTTNIIKQIKPLKEATWQTSLPLHQNSLPPFSLCTSCSDQTRSLWYALTQCPDSTRCIVAEDAASQALRNSTETELQGCPSIGPPAQHSGSVATAHPPQQLVSSGFFFFLLKNTYPDSSWLICRTVLGNCRKSPLCHMQTPDTAPPGTALRHIQVPQSTWHNLCGCEGTTLTCSVQPSDCLFQELWTRKENQA